MKQAFVYILASGKKGTLYVGVTSDLVRRVYEHKHDQSPGFTQRYAIHRLVYFESHTEMREAIRREKQIKKWRRAWKLRLIQGANPGWRDLYTGIVG